MASILSGDLAAKDRPRALRSCTGARRDPSYENVQALTCNSRFSGVAELHGMGIGCKGEKNGGKRRQVNGGHGWLHYVLLMGYIDHCRRCEEILAHRHNAR
ncbi:hypothetical protein XCV1853 [Xanthomonas euvesicatoria pv. vesicatoria str. 85-10]|uniref:Uncharacterized protein n=1 Tax=Xanthomonas euvesicatoria pv. vesicatoria (strain 85-10) TaxID=316273 RepID=Q3BUH9_XANE5|nr:hypothetical protein XCV1853 [Xanthomonas euvesicatoria pv. vesicatoria str. 85-10]